jgi:transketolase
MRRAFASELYNIMKDDKEVILIVGDIGFSVFRKIKEDFPDRYINMGVCEQSTTGLCAGMALMGLKPYFYTITPFLVERCFEQVKIDINLNNVNVKLIGYDDYPGQGPTHEVTDDASFMRVFKNIKSYWPTNSNETKHAVRESYELKCPTFIRLKEDKNLQ